MAYSLIAIGFLIVSEFLLGYTVLLALINISSMKRNQKRKDTIKHVDKIFGEELDQENKDDKFISETNNVEKNEIRSNKRKYKKKL